MASRDRIVREKQELKALILKTAIDIYLSEGYDAVSIRAIADKIDYSPATIYLYFKDKKSIWLAISNYGFSLFGQKLAECMVEQDRFERMRIMGYKYLEFSQEHPKMYDIMFIREDVIDDGEESPEYWENDYQSFGFLKQQLAEAMAEGAIRKMDLDAAALMFWGLPHGLASLLVKCRLSMYGPGEQERLTEVAMDQFMRALKP